jgi:hypothetical protein
MRRPKSVVRDFDTLPREQKSVLAICMMYPAQWVTREVIIGKIQALGLLRMTDEQFEVWLTKLIAEIKQREDGE